MNDRPGGQRRRTFGRWVRLGVLALGLGAGPARAEDPAQRDTRLAQEHVQRRLPAIRAALAAASPGFVFLAGNSHAELLGNALAGRFPVVNGGIGGASARSYAARLETLPFGARAGIAVLFVGTNDILRTGAPLSKGTLAGFEAAVTRSLARLRQDAEVVLVAAVPPIGPEAVAARDPAAVPVYSAALRRLCEPPACRFFDPFAGLRDGPAGVTTRAAPPDGVHLRDYDGLAAALATDLTAVLRGRSAADRERTPD